MHSNSNGENENNMLKLKIPPPVYMLMMAGLMWLLNHFLPIAYIVTAPWHQFGFLVILIALFTDGFSLMQFFRAHTSINPLHPEKANRLVITGMYRLTRNPMYLGLLLVLVGWAIVLGSVSSFIVLPLFVVILTVQQIIPEEKVLEQKFGQQYRDYKQSVRRWL